MAGRLGRGEVRFYEFAPPDKRRPVLILTRDSSLAALSWVTIAPITSTIRGIASEVVLTAEDGMKSLCAINLHNLITVPQSRMGRRVTQLSEERMREVCAALHYAMGCLGN